MFSLHSRKPCEATFVCLAFLEARGEDFSLIDSPTVSNHGRPHYWLVNRGGGWVFADHQGHKPVRPRTHVETPIVRHIKVQGKRSPFDGDWSYWATRMGKHPELPAQLAKLLKHQHGQCSYCSLYFKLEDLLEVHHLDGNRHNHKRENLTLLHQHCHDQVHSGMHDKHPVVEKPDAWKQASPVLQTSRVGDCPT